jgi:hypothetical protein
MPDVNLWVVMLLVQSIPYAAAVVMSLIGALPQLPASLLGGSLTEIRGASARGSHTGCPKIMRDRPPREP